MIFSRSTPKEKLRVLDGVWILYAIMCINNCDAHLDTEIPTFAQFKQSVLPSIKEKYAFHQKWGSRFFNRNNPVHCAQSIPDVIEALTLRAKLASSEGKEESASMKVLAESFVHGLGF